MASTQFSVRIPPTLDQRLKAYAACNSTTKSEVMVAALAQYLGCTEDVPLTQKMVILEERLASLERIIQSQAESNNVVNPS